MYTNRMQAAATRAFNYVTGALPTVEDLKETTKYTEITVGELGEISAPPPGTKFYAVKNDTSEVLALTYTPDLKTLELNVAWGGYDDLPSRVPILKSVNVLPFKAGKVYFITDTLDQGLTYSSVNGADVERDLQASKYTFYKTVNSSTPHTVSPLTLIAPTGGSKRKTRKQSRRVRNKRSKKSRGRRS